MKLFVCLVAAVVISRVKTTLLSQSDEDNCVDEHNTARGVGESGSNLKKMKWDSDLASLASSWADQCKFGHGMLDRPTSDSSYKQKKGTRVGQNIYYAIGGSSGMPSVTDGTMPGRSVGGWMDEKPNYYFGMGCLDAAGQPAPLCGHYTQVVWAPTDYLGCAMAACPTVTDNANNAVFTNAVVFVCDYYEAGNVAYQDPYMLGNHCSACGTVTALGNGYTCSSGLCVECSIATDTDCECPSPAPPCLNGGAASTTDCACDCSATDFRGAQCDLPCHNSAFCVDSAGPEQCAGLAGYCPDPLYKDFMSSMCMKTCGFCAQGC